MVKLKAKQNIFQVNLTLLRNDQYSWYYVELMYAILITFYGLINDKMKMTARAKPFPAIMRNNNIVLL